MTCASSLLLRRLTLALLLLTAALTFVGTRFPVDLALHHVGTLAGALILVWIDRRWRLSGPAFVAAVAFLAAHVLGARYLYSLVPYDAWSEALIGRRLSDVFGWERNHYDRLVHFLYGLLLGLPSYELLRTRTSLRPALSAVLVLTFVLATSALYELLEWGLAVTLAPESAERYNGQQGDMWDAQKDMALATLGAVITLVVCVLRRDGDRDA